MTQTQLNQWYEDHIAPYVAPNTPDPEAIAAQIYAIAGSDIIIDGAVKDFNSAVNGYEVRDNIVYLAMLNRAYNDIINDKSDDVISGANKISRIPGIVNQSGYDITSDLTHTNTEYNGIIYQWDGNQCTLSGEATGDGSVNILFTDHRAFPAGIVPGGVYYVTAEGFPASRVAFSIRCYKPSSIVGEEDVKLNDVYIRTNGKYTVPTDATGITIRLFVRAGTVISNPITVTVGLSATPSNTMLHDSVNGRTDNITLIADGLITKRKFTTSDVTEGRFFNLGRENRAFNEADRYNADAGYATLFVPFAAGDTILLHTKAGKNNGKPYALIKYNQLIDKIFPVDYNIDDDTDEFDGVIAPTYDGWLAVNVKVTELATFNCEIITVKSKVYDGAVLSDTERIDGYRSFVAYNSNNVCRTLNTGMGMAAMIKHWAIIGASFDSGEFNYNDGTDEYELEWYKHSCWEYFKNMNGITDLRNYSDGGQNARDWIRLTKNSNISSVRDGHGTARGYYYDKDYLVQVPNTLRRGIGPGGGCWWKMLDDYRAGAVNQAFVINLGSNDINNNYTAYQCGTVDDIGTFSIDLSDPTDYGTDIPPTGKTGGSAVSGVVNSYAGYMGAIINRIIAIQPDAIIFVATIRNGFANTLTRFTTWIEYNALLKALETKYSGNVYIIDNGEFGPNYGAEPMLNMFPVYNGNNAPHPNAIGYKHLADVWNTLIDYTIQKNYEAMKTSMFIDYDRYVNMKHVDLIKVIHPQTESSYGNSFIWDENRCDINVNRTSNLQNILFSNYNAFPQGVKKGKSYHIKYATEDNRTPVSQLQFVYYVNFNLPENAEYITIDGEDDITIPDDADITGMRIRVFVQAGGGTLEETVVANMFRVE